MYCKRTHSEGREFNYFSLPDNLLLTLTFTLSCQKLKQNTYSKYFILSENKTIAGTFWLMRQTFVDMPQQHWSPNVTKLTCLDWETANVSSKHGGLKWHEIKSLVETWHFALWPIKALDVTILADWTFPMFSGANGQCSPAFPLENASNRRRSPAHEVLSLCGLSVRPTKWTWK